MTVSPAARRSNGSPSRWLQCGRYRLPLEHTLIMGIVNITPDSFSDGGQFFDTESAVAHALELVQDGADLIDLGAESTRPDARFISAEEELDRLLPVLDRLRDLSVPVSIDTYKAEVMRAVLARGASMINDVRALQGKGALEAVRDSNCAVCLMHSKGDAQTMQSLAQYEDVLDEVKAFLAQRVRECEAAGIARQRIVIDPGFGFAKRNVHTLALMRELASLCELGVPILAGISRKSTLGRITGRPDGERLSASVAAAMLMAQRGAAIVRVHDVAQTRDALRVLQAVEDPHYQLQ